MKVSSETGYMTWCTVKISWNLTARKSNKTYLAFWSSNEFYVRLYYILSFSSTLSQNPVSKKTRRKYHVINPSQPMYMYDMTLDILARDIHGRYWDVYLMIGYSGSNEFSCVSRCSESQMIMKSAMCSVMSYQLRIASRVTVAVA